MDNETQKIFEEQLLKLPSEVVTFLDTSNWNQDLEDIGSLYNLNSEQIIDYKREVTLVLAGLEHPDDFTSHIQEELLLEGTLLEAIVTATEEKVFSSVRPALLAFFESEVAENSTGNAEPLSAEIPAHPEVAQIPSVIAPQGTPENLPFAPEPEHLIPPIPPKVASLEIPPVAQIPVEKATIPPAPTPAPPQSTMVPDFIAPMPQTFEPIMSPRTADDNGQAVHPFEEKMRQVFTSARPTAENIVLSQAPQAVSSPAELAASQPVPAFVPPVAATLQTAPSRHADPYREPIE